MVPLSLAAGTSSFGFGTIIFASTTALTRGSGADWESI
jgi:hypothetical protein